MLILDDEDNVTSKKPSINRKRKSIEEDENDEDEDKLLESFLKCKACLNNYDMVEKKPTRMRPCKDTICNDCFKQLSSMKCPLCFRVVKTNSFNSTIVSLLEGGSSEIVRLYFIH